MERYSSKKNRKLYSLIAMVLGVLLTLTIADTAKAQNPDSSGTDFWLTFPFDHKGGFFATTRLYLFLTGATDTTGTVTIPGQAFSVDFSVTAGDITTVPIPLASGQMSNASDTIENKGIHVQAQAEITVYGLSRRRYTTDAYLGLPTDILGTVYVVLSYETVGSNNTSQFAIVGSEDGTTVTITPSVTTGAYPAGAPYTINLEQGEVYQLRNNTVGADLSGTIIASDKPIAVFGSHSCANVPVGFGFCDFLIEQLSPTSTWGREFVTMPLATRKKGDTFRFAASVDGTTVSVNNTLVATLNRGEFHEQIITDTTRINANQPILVGQYSNGTEFDNVTSDPFMMLLPPFEQFLSDYTVATPASGFKSNYINVIVSTPAVGSITLNDAIIPPTSFTPIGTSGFSGAQVKVSLGTHNLVGPLPFGVFVYGYDDADSYGYPGGASLAPVAQVANLTATPKNATHVVDTEQCVTAIVTDQNDDPLVGIRVDFSSSGDNATNGFAFTDANGQAQFCYTGTNPGTDSIVASIGTLLSDTATKLWEANILSNLTVTPKNATHPVNTEQCVTATVTNQYDDPLGNSQVDFESSGVNITNGSAFTAVDGQAQFCYTGTNPGTDSIVASTGTLSDTATKLWEAAIPSSYTIYLPLIKKETPPFEVPIDP